MIQICAATLGRKRLCLVLGGVVHKSILENRPAAPQSFELPSPVEEYGTFYKHRAGRYSPDYRLADGNVRVAERLYRARQSTERCTRSPDVC
ncbi:hypothetical protein TNCV_792981 [Trichonephila clavipes]|nr:hypothetical protein TNCV_792981 [Trichonephila clavipes]